MMAQASGLGMGIGRFSRPRRGVVVITMSDLGLDTTRHVEVPVGAGVLQLLVPCVAVIVCIAHCSVADRAELPR
jgi:hypothetical protein